MYSMTGYGQALQNSFLGKLRFEIKSVNRKSLDISIKDFPKECSHFELLIRKEIAKYVSRGQISVEVSLDQKTWFTSQRKNLLKKEKKNFEHLAKDLGFDPSVVDFAFLVDHMDLVTTIHPVPSNFENTCISGLSKALKAFNGMRAKEGKIIEQFLLSQLKKVEQTVEFIDRHKKKIVEQHEKKLKEKILQLSGQTFDEVMQQRFLQEVVIFADRYDVTEEILRLHAHLQQFSSLCSVTKEAVGKKMDFICQELLREPA